MKRTLFGLALACAPLLAHASCEDNFARWTQQLQPGRALDQDRAAVCKAWPANEALTIAALPLTRPGNTDIQGTDDLEVLVADTATGAIVAHRFEKSALQFDAVAIRDLVIDTAPYQLTPQLRAFGIRVDYDNMSRASPYEAKALSLYVMEGARLRKVLGGLTVKESGGEWDENCAGTRHETERTLAMGAADKSGYAALRVTSKTDTTVSALTAGNCVDHTKTAKPSIATLPYRDGRYEVPKDMRYSD
ncbi:hypothetical protein [Bordetella sp. FB-8]|uniref:hypothetical protein n=1 Tax=Bordetella sp. FB-8 TaxID=1159870 RepID=UPI0003A813DD|nr:hypothetical protein [Bordetella sp. FB-8]